MRFEIKETTEVGRNAHWSFCVGRVGGRWVGYALAHDPVPGEGGVPIQYLHFFSRVSEGFEMGVSDRGRAIRMVGALAEDPGGGFGGIDTWAVAPELRGTPDEFRCPVCDEVCCEGGHDEDPDTEVEYGGEG